jgi:hypothetical protein
LAVKAIATIGTATIARLLFESSEEHATSWFGTSKWNVYEDQNEKVSMREVQIGYETRNREELLPRTWEGERGGKTSPLHRSMNTIIEVRGSEKSILSSMPSSTFQYKLCVDLFRKLVE